MGNISGPGNNSNALVTLWEKNTLMGSLNVFAIDATPARVAVPNTPAGRRAWFALGFWDAYAASYQSNRFNWKFGLRSQARNSVLMTNFFNPAVGAKVNGGQRMLRNTMREFFNPQRDLPQIPLLKTDESYPIKPLDPLVQRGTGMLNGDVKVVFSRPVKGLRPSDLHFNSIAGRPYDSVIFRPETVVASGPDLDPVTGLCSEWTFSGPADPLDPNNWITLSAQVQLTDTPLMRTVFDATKQDVAGTPEPANFSHAYSADSLGVPGPVSWTWIYLWSPNPASVDSKLWAMYE